MKQILSDAVGSLVLFLCVMALLAVACFDCLLSAMRKRRAVPCGGGICAEENE